MLHRRPRAEAKSPSYAVQALLDGLARRPAAWAVGTTTPLAGPKVLPRRRIYLNGQPLGHLGATIRLRTARVGAEAYGPICVEGFPRSGTTFAEILVSLLHPSHPVLAHGHSPLGLHPVSGGSVNVLVLREPLLAARSLVLWATTGKASWLRPYSNLSLERALRWWIDFHSAILNLPNKATIEILQPTSNPQLIEAQLLVMAKPRQVDFIRQTMQVARDIVVEKDRTALVGSQQAHLRTQRHPPIDGQGSRHEELSAVSALLASEAEAIFSALAVQPARGIKG